jgi:hypothetical protein
VQRYVPAESLEELVWQQVAQLLQQPALILEHYHQLQHQAPQSSLEYQEQRRLSQQVERLHQQGQRLLDAYQNGMVELEELQRRQERIAERQELLQQRLNVIEERLGQVAQQVELREGLETFSQRIQKALENPSFEDKQRILRLVIERIEVGPEEITVKHSIPLPLYPLRTNDLSSGQLCFFHPIHLQPIATLRLLEAICCNTCLASHCGENVDLPTLGAGAGRVLALRSTGINLSQVLTGQSLHLQKMLWILSHLCAVIGCKQRMTGHAVLASR